MTSTASPDDPGGQPAEPSQVPREWRWDQARRSDRGHRWGGGSGAGRPRPPWWPEDEAWPARRSRRRRPFGCLFGLVVLLGAVGLLSLALGVVGALLAAPGPSGVAIRVAALAVGVGLLVGFVRFARLIRGSGTVLDGLVDQAARVEAGDYAARVDVRGPVPRPMNQLVRGFNTMAARLEADDRRRRDLLADVTHELRTPIAVIQGSVEAIIDGIHQADETHLGAILEETHVLGRLVEDLRTLAESDAGTLALHREPTDLDVLVGDVLTSFAAQAATAGVEVRSATDDGIPLLDVDPVRIREVVANLVANALRHTPSGGWIEVAARPGTPLGVVDIVVSDTGTGIAPDLLPHVFERFVRGDRSAGSGLGLAIARGLVERHGGTIEAAPRPGGGTVIRLTLPVSTSHAG